MKSLVLLTEADPSAWERATEAERAAIHEKHYAFSAAVSGCGAVVSGEALTGADSARTLRTVDGSRVVTNGSYADTGEQLCGFYLIDVADLDTALELCRVLPESYTIEVRPAVNMGDDTP